MARARRRHPRLPDAAVARIARRFRALGDPARLRILNRLMEGEQPVQELLRQTGLSQTNLSRHLGVLRREGLVERRSDGNRARYRICDPALVEVCEIVCGSLAEQLGEELSALERAVG